MKHVRAIFVQGLPTSLYANPYSLTIDAFNNQAEADLKTAKDCLEDGNYYATAFFSQ